MTDYAAAYKNPSHVYHREAKSLVAKFTSDATVDANGIVRWTTVQRVPPQDILDFWHAIGLAFDHAASTAQRAADTDAFLVEMRATTPKEPSQEMLAEARAAHGPGVTLVNVLTGRKFTT